MAINAVYCALQFFLKNPISKRRFFGKEHFDDLNREHSKFCLSVYISICFFAGFIFIKDCIISTEYATISIGVLGLLGSVYMFLLTLLEIIHRDK